MTQAQIDTLRERALKRLLANNLQRVGSRPDWDTLHNAAVTRPRGFERAIVEGFVALNAIAEAYKLAHFSAGDPIGTDGYAEPYFTDMCRAMIKLLSMDIGRLDGGTCDGAIRQLATDHGCDGDTL
jgi:hypothetical protein